MWNNKSTKSLVNNSVEMKNIKNLKLKNTNYKSVDSIKTTGVYDQSTLLGFAEKLK